MTDPTTRMDGLLNLDTLSPATPAHSGVQDRQRTIASPICCTGIGLHSGQTVRLTLRPAPADSGIVFHRSDLPGTVIPARYDHVVDTRLCTVLGTPSDPARVGTVEHLMAALVGAGIDNIRVEIDGPELPILDGSADAFLFLLDCAGTEAQFLPRRTIAVLRPVRVTDGASWAELHPQPEGAGFDLDLTIDFPAAAIGHQSLALRLTPDSFRHQLAAARTFTLAAEIDQLRAAGLARGGSLDNAVVVDGARVLNPGGLRMELEFVRHKMLDAVGDLALAGASLVGRFVAHRTGHALNNQLLRALFADAANWRPATAPWLAAA